MDKGKNMKTVLFMYDIEDCYRRHAPFFSRYLSFDCMKTICQKIYRQLGRPIVSLPNIYETSKILLRHNDYVELTNIILSNGSPFMLIFFSCNIPETVEMWLHRQISSVIPADILIIFIPEEWIYTISGDLFYPIYSLENSRLIRHDRPILNSEFVRTVDMAREYHESGAIVLPPGNTFTVSPGRIEAAAITIQHHDTEMIEDEIITRKTYDAQTNTTQQQPIKKSRFSI